MLMNLLRVLPLAAIALLIGTAAYAGSCVTASCHGAVVKYKFLHGPLAMEPQTDRNCISCHVKAGKACTASTKGDFTFAEEKDKLCTMCHEKSDSPDHVGRVTGCIRCHNPHGSDKTSKLLKF